MLVRSLKELLTNKLLLVGLIGLLLGQLLYIAGFGALFVVSLFFVLAVGLPYPAVLRSLVSRLVVAGLLAFGIIQVAAVVQFFAFPDSDFTALSLIATLLSIGLVIGLQRYVPKERLVLWDNKDAAAALMAAFFVVPFALWCFWGNDPSRLLAFGGRQSPDGAAHNVAFDEMHGKQHLTYRTNPTYYPKGFHIANALVMDSFGLHKKDNTWQANARIFVSQYIVWGALLAFVLYYLGRQLAEKFVAKLRPAATMMLAFVLGPALALFYLLPFAQEGFLNFYYICAAFACSLLFLRGFALQTVPDAWFVWAYFVCAFGITMSWGPLLLPAVAAIPLLYILASGQKLAQLLRQIVTKKYLLTVVAGCGLLIVPLYLHFSYASENAFNAYGSIRTLNYALLLSGLMLCAFLALSKKVPSYVKNFAIYAVMPTWLLVGLLVAAQYLLAGEPRYYSIKTSYLLEMILLALAAVTWLALVAKSNLTEMQRWLVAPLIFGSVVFLLISANGNPLAALHKMNSQPLYFQSDVQKVASLGVAGELKVSNNIVLHYMPAENKLSGAPLIPNWANALSPNNEGNPDAAACTSTIFSTLAYGSGSAQEQTALVQAVKGCINDRVDKQKKPYFIITDPDSVPHLKRLLGDKATFL